MTFKNKIGCSVNIESTLSADKVLFSETGGFVVEITRENFEKVQSVFSSYGLNVFEIGITGGALININELVELAVKGAKEAWENGLRDKL